MVGRGVADLLDAYAFIAADNPSAAERVQDRLVEAARTLRDLPNRGREGRKHGTRELKVSDTPYLIVYTVGGEAVTILRLWHGARKPFE
ncbi:MAG: type II toxin-antitoxin system mRNA interferase toxin, RelE/StbE family [Brevundimonas sp.]|uniref:Type II toxin-antitoxin system RelE/ParE family toxin n=1 Tax=Brevundimonas albigilva TaxID=1312364 RepID=A0ABY4SLL2_9CAUL|nr:MULTISPECIES: type II toxin-antitoxin system RelE/ParE family toxin [Brevundimonas]PZU60035.1 MAG: type II toxin-antitoxin system mRNA interferase toxin, RelE/StbE family [Brevundimonas sp.]UQV17227.1 type II toxin-antitoxin system RelE/ParE family toxin [Brevundimonas albigilva]URI14955.1 type II toxin-antitoxin system RelE/ParE family toxin [Brevundimonas albigilva]